MDRLPDTIILKIFKMLPLDFVLLVCTLVCKKWDRISKDSSLYQKFTFCICSVRVNYFLHLISCGARSFNFSFIKLDCREVNPGLWSELSNCNKMRSLLLHEPIYWERRPDVSTCSLIKCSDKSPWAQILSTCNLLEELWLKKSDIVVSGILKEIINLKNLRVLHISDEMEITGTAVPEIMQMIGSNLTQLKSLMFKRCKISKEALTSISENLKAPLKFLSLVALHELQDQHVINFVERCPSITTLDLSENSQITSRSIQAINHNLVNLSVLNLNFCGYDLFARAMITRHTLVCLFVKGNELSSKSVKNICWSFPLLVSLDLQLCKLSKESLSVLSTYIPNGMKHLILSNNENVKENEISNIVLRCPKLISLDIVGCSPVSLKIIQEIVKFQSIENLKLDAQNCNLFEVLNLLEHLKQVKNLKNLYVCGFYNSQEFYENLKLMLNNVNIHKFSFEL